MFNFNEMSLNLHIEEGQQVPILTQYTGNSVHDTLYSVQSVSELPEMPQSGKNKMGKGIKVRGRNKGQR